MSSTTLHPHPLQPTQWSLCMGMCVCKEPIEKSRYSLNSGTGSPKQDFANELLTKEAGR